MNMTIKIYFNDVILGDPARVRPNCPYFLASPTEAKSIAQNKISSGEWTSYLIPDLHDTPVVFEDDVEDNE